MSSVPARQEITATELPRCHDLFSSIWAEHKSRLYTLCLRWVGGHASDAEDIVGEVALRALEERRANAVIMNYGGWLTRLAWNLCMDRHRERAHRQKALERFSAEGGALVTDVASQPDVARSRRELGERIFGALERLPPRLREPCELRFVEEMPYEVIAVRLGLTNETVRKRIQEARAILERRLIGVE